MKFWGKKISENINFKNLAENMKNWEGKNSENIKFSEKIASYIE